MKTKGTIKKGGRSRGFSLLELLAVMSIMAMLTTLAVTSYFSAIRGMTRRSAVKHLANTLILARQRACMEGTRVSVMIFNEIIGYDAAQPRLAPSYVVCKAMGRISYLGNGALVDEFEPLDKMFGVSAAGASSSYLGSFRLYNLTRGKWWNVVPTVTSVPLGGRASAYRTVAPYEIPAFGFVENTKVVNANRSDWQVGDSYGVEVAPVNALPRNFLFDTINDSISSVLTVTFQPDGSVADGGNGVTIKILTTQVPITGSSVSVKSDGSITYDEKWN